MTLYDRNGTPAAYIDSDGEHIYLFDGKLDGYCVMFTDEARTQGPAKPSRHETPAKWARAARPVRRSRETKRSKTAYKAAWSEIAAGDFLSGNS